MKTLLIGASSSLALALHPLLAEFSEVSTAGRVGSDVNLDLTSEIVIPAGFDAVVNTAAYHGDESAPSVVRTQLTNVLGTLKLCIACTEAGVRQLVQVSSIFAELPSTSPFFNSYALSKRQGDEVAENWATRNGLPLTVIRPAQLYGVGETYRRNQPFLFNLMDRAQANEDIVLDGSNDARRNYLHVEDAARAIALTVQHKVLGTFQCAYPEDVRYSQVAGAAIAAFGSRSEVRFDASRPDIADNVFTPNNTLYGALGFTPQISMTIGMQMEAEHRRVPE